MSRFQTPNYIKLLAKKWLICARRPRNRYKVSQIPYLQNRPLLFFKFKFLRLLLASTSEIYGDPEEHPQKEEYWGHVNPIGPRACYDEGKRVAETMCYAYQKQEGVDVRVARIFNTYG